MSAILEFPLGGLSELIELENFQMNYVPKHFQCEMPDPFAVAGHACHKDVSSGNIETTVASASGTLEKQIIHLSLDMSIGGQDDCLAMDESWYWTSYSCEEAQTLYMTKTEMNAASMSMTQQLQMDLMAALLWEPICCHEQDQDPEQEFGETELEVEFPTATDPFEKTQEDIKEFWWNSMRPWRDGHSKYLIIIKGIMSIVSVLCSSFLIYILLSSPDRLLTTQNRLLFGLCLADISFSLPQCFFGMMVPMQIDYFSWNARGTMATCQMQGFFTTFGGICGQAYNASLCLNYLAIVKYEKSAEYIQTKIEPYLHAVPLAIATTWCTIAIATGKINPDGQGCCLYNDYSPPHCWDDHFKEDYGYDFAKNVDTSMNIDIDIDIDIDINGGIFDIPCRDRDRSPLAIIMTVSTLLYLITPPFVMVVALTMIYKTVRQQETKVSKYGRGSLRLLDIDTAFVLREREENKRSNSSANTNAATSSSSSGATSSSSAWSWDRLKPNFGCVTSICKFGFGKSESLEEESLYMRKLKKSNSKRRSQRQSRSVMYKGLAYSCSWFLTWILYIVAMILVHLFSVGMKPTTLLYLIHIFMPIQGVYNLVIYMYPKVASIKRGPTSRSRSRLINDSDDDNITWRKAVVSAFRNAIEGEKETRRNGGRRRSRHRRLSTKLRKIKIRQSECSMGMQNTSMSTNTKTNTKSDMSSSMKSDMSSSMKSLKTKLRTSLEKVKCKPQTSRSVNHLSFGNIRSSRYTHAAFESDAYTTSNTSICSNKGGDEAHAAFESDAYTTSNTSTCSNKVGDEAEVELDAYFCEESSI